ncbi:MAG: hypothetical protein EAX86_03855 [Candidatus Heimdallarchaeota archaeon]|nr:hypothetical protein [Candidatus Heimdallarchaeota archaeon]
MEGKTISIEEIVPTIEKVKNTIEAITQELEQKEKLLTEREEKLNKASKELDEANLKRQQLEFDYMSLEAEFKRISDLFKEMSGKQEVTLDIKQLLSIYITLLEQVFAAQPHAKILYILHGDKNAMNREELTKATGFAPAIILHSLHELNRAELVSYNEETGQATLTNRIYE